jgi:pilus assembly protein CpaF
MTFLRSCVRARLNILVSGGTGSGKTTLLNILSSFIPETERLITCEDAAELQLQQPHWIQLESRPPNVEGKGAVPIRELVKSCLRMRPDRIIVGECRGGEALDMLQAMNTGHDGSMSTLHANNPKECLVRLETLVLQAGQDLPSRAIRETIGAAIHLIVQQSRLRGGVRRIVSVAEIIGMKDGEVTFQELFTFKQIGVNTEGKAVGYHTATGLLPMRMEHLKAEGEDVPEALFRPTPQPPADKLY